jgi:branched-chain amino acid transport system ATP-binding protein
MALLELNDIDAGYGGKQVLFNVSLRVDKGEIVAIIGPNGSGKSTALKAAFGLVPVWRGEVLFDGITIHGTHSVHNVAGGISFAPQGDRVFDNLTVAENLEVGALHLPTAERRKRLGAVFQLFPILAERAREPAGSLSGGQQQMVALARALVPQPALLLLDEPSLGLSPNLMRVIFEQIAKINRELDTTVLIVEQKVRAVLELCHRVYALKLGSCVFCGQPTTPAEKFIYTSRRQRLACIGPLERLDHGIRISRQGYYSPTS